MPTSPLLPACYPMPDLTTNLRLWCPCHAVQYMITPTELVPTGLPVVPEPARSKRIEPLCTPA